MIILLAGIAVYVVSLLVLQFYIVYEAQKNRENKEAKVRINRLVMADNKTDKSIFLNFVNHSELFDVIENIEDKKYAG